MEEKLIRLAIILRTLKIYDFETRSDIAFLMNRLFMAENIGIPTGYSFQWKGTQPYSEELYKDIGELYLNYDEDYITDQIGEGRMKSQYYILAVRLNLLFTKCPYNYSIKRWTGLLVCVRYFELAGFNSETELVYQVRKVNSHFEKNDIILAKRIYDVLLEPVKTARKE